MCGYRSSLLAPLILVAGIGTALGQSAADGTASVPVVSDVSRFDGGYCGTFETTQTRRRRPPAKAVARDTIIK